MKKYSILTQKSILDTQEESEQIALWEEQNKIINGEYFAIHFLNDPYFVNESYELSNDISETIQYLAIKEGIDLVKFDNNNLGFVAYYGSNENAFEFKVLSKEEYNSIHEEEIKNLF